MEFQLIFSDQAKEKLLVLETDKSKKGLLKQLRKALGLMETNLKHPSLNTHKFDAIQCKLGDVFESYVQNKTPGAFRIFWAYGPGQNKSIFWILPHIPKVHEAEGRSLLIQHVYGKSISLLITLYLLS